QRKRRECDWRQPGNNCPDPRSPLNRTNQMELVGSRVTMFPVSAASRHALLALFSVAPIGPECGRAGENTVANRPMAMAKPAKPVMKRSRSGIGSGRGQAAKRSVGNVAMWQPEAFAVHPLNIIRMSPAVAASHEWI